MPRWMGGIEAAMSSYGILGTYEYFWRKKFVPEFEAWADGMILEKGTDMPTWGGGQRQVVDAWADGMILERG